MNSDQESHMMPSLMLILIVITNMLLAAQARDSAEPSLVVGRSIQAMFPVIDYPRLWLKVSDLPRLRSWTVDSNLAYQDVLSREWITAQSSHRINASRLRKLPNWGNSVTLVTNNSFNI